MSKYTDEQVMAKAAHFVADGTLEVAGMLHGYAATLSRPAEWPSDADVEGFCESMAVNTETIWEDYSEDEKKACRKATRAALQSVRPPASRHARQVPDVSEQLVDAIRHRVGCEDGLDITPAQVRCVLKHERIIAAPPAPEKD